MSKLTLHVDPELVRSVKHYAKRHHISVSQLVSVYFKRISQRIKPVTASAVQSLPPLTASLKGVIKQTKIDEKEYYKYLEEKHRSSSSRWRRGNCHAQFKGF